MTIESFFEKLRKIKVLLWMINTVMLLISSGILDIWADNSAFELFLARFARDNTTKIVVVNEEDLKEICVGEEICIYAIGLDETQQIPYSVFDENVLSYESSNDTVCSVECGVLQAKAEGIAEITIKAYYGGASTKLRIHVFDKAVESKSVKKALHANEIETELFSDGTNAERNTIALIHVLEYASMNGYEKIYFDKGTYLIEPYYCPIRLPSNMEVDFNGSLIIPVRNNRFIEGKKGYTVFLAENVSNLTFCNAVVYGENYYGEEYHLESERSFSVSGDSENIEIVDCEFSYSPGFNFSIGYTRKHQVGVKLDNIEPGNLNRLGIPEKESAQSCFRTREYIDISPLQDDFGLGNMQGFQGYLYMQSRLFDIYFYDENYSCVGVLYDRIQYQEYCMPYNAKYAKIVFYQEKIPTACDPDTHSIASIYDIGNPKRVYIRNCTFCNNISSGASLQGGKCVLLDNCTFINNGKYDPAASVVWEDGRIHIQNHIVRNCTFQVDSSEWNGQIINQNSQISVFHNNCVEDLPFIYSSESQNARIFNNEFKTDNIQLASKTDLFFWKNACFAEPIITAEPAGGHIVMYENSWS